MCVRLAMSSARLIMVRVVPRTSMVFGYQLSAMM